MKLLTMIAVLCVVLAGCSNPSDNCIIDTEDELKRAKEANPYLDIKIGDRYFHATPLKKGR